MLNYLITFRLIQISAIHLSRIQPLIHKFWMLLLEGCTGMLPTSIFGMFWILGQLSHYTWQAACQIVIFVRNFLLNAILDLHIVSDLKFVYSKPSGPKNREFSIHLCISFSSFQLSSDFTLFYFPSLFSFWKCLLAVLLNHLVCSWWLSHPFSSALMDYNQLMESGNTCIFIYFHIKQWKQL